MYNKTASLRLCTMTACAALTLLGAAPTHAQTPATQTQTTAPQTQTPAPVAQAPAPQIIDLGKMTDAQIGPLVSHIGSLRTKTLVTQPSGTVAIQSGTVPKHTHAHSVEIQYIIAGHGKFWLGDKQYDVHPGDLIVIPENTVHGETSAKNSRFKVLAIKLPPQQAGDMHLVP